MSDHRKRYQLLLHVLNTWVNNAFSTNTLCTASAADTPGCLIYSLRIEESDPSKRAAEGLAPVIAQYDTGTHAGHAV